MTRLVQSVSGSGNVQPFDLTDRGLLLADGVFDTSRVSRGRMLLRRAHLVRLVGDAAALGIGVELADLESLANDAIAGKSEGALRLTVTRGPGARGLAGEGEAQPTLIARFSAMDMPFPAAPVRLAISDICRNPTSPTARHKTLSYTDNIMALRGAVASGADEALMLSPEGNVACASAANVFAIFGNRLVTPPLSDGALPGILRSWLLAQPASAPLFTYEESLTPERLAAADHVFLTNSLRIFQPVSALAGREWVGEIPPQLLPLGHALLGGRFDD